MRFTNRLGSMYVHDMVNRFKSREVEKAFGIFYITQNKNIAKISLPLYVFGQFLISISEAFADDKTSKSRRDGRITIPFRLVIIIVALCSLYAILKKSSNFQKFRYKFLQGALFIIGLLLLAMQFTVSLHSNTDEYLFYAGRWSLADSIVFVLLCFHCSGMLFVDVAWICSSYIMACTMLPHFLFFKTLAIDRISIFVLPVLLVFELSYLNDYECEMRERYVSHLQAGQALTRQDKLINSILPAEISNALKLNQYDKLMNYYPAVTILFCYIVDFTQQACANPSKDTVALCFRIVSALDHIVEQTGAYKVENIADTYMACAGCPTETENNAEIMAHTAIAMIRASHRYNWRWSDGTPVELKIGLHSGSVTGGVVGTKSYSFHLFGDAVNTASRMCSNSSPGRILMSTRCYNRLTRNGNDTFITEERGQVAVKGKGMMNLFWLNSYKEKQKIFRGSLGAKQTNPDKALLERFKNLCESSSTKIIVNRCTLRFQLQNSENRSRRKKGLERNNISHNKIAQAMLRSFSGSRVASGAQLVPLQENSVVENNPVAGPSISLSSFRSRSIRNSSDGDKVMYLYDRQETVQSDYDYKPPLPIFEEPEDEVEESPEQMRQLRKTVVDMEIAFKRENDWKVLPQQRKYLWAAGFCTLGTYVYFVNDTHEVEWLLLCAVSIAMLSLYLTKFTAFGIQYSQLVIVSTLAISSAAIRLRVSLLAKNNGASTYSAVIYTLAIIFSVIFFRLRSHYLVGCLVAYATFWLILRHLYGLATAESNNAYGVTCMLISLLVSVVREYSARVEYATAFMLDQETKKSRDLLSNMLPRRENAQALLNGEFVCEELKDVTLLYSDLKGFTDFASNKHPLQLAKLLDAIYSSFDRHLNHFGLYKIDIIGDAFVVVGGIAGRVHVKNPTLNCVMYAFHMLHDLQEINRQYGSNLKLRIGIHTGDAVGSVISLNKPRYLIWGASTIIANYMESSGEAGLVNISWEAMQKLDIFELTMLNIHIPCTIPFQADFDSLPQETNYLLCCDDISEFLHDVGIDAETVQEVEEHHSLLSSAYKRLKGQEELPNSFGWSNSILLNSSTKQKSPTTDALLDSTQCTDRHGNTGHFSFTDGTVSAVDNNMASPYPAKGSQLEDKFFPKNLELDHTGGAEFVFETQLRAVTITMPGDWAQYGTKSKAGEDTTWGYF